MNYGNAIRIDSETQWHALRGQCVVTASSVAALLVPHPFETPFSIWHRAHGRYQIIEEDEAMAAGTDAEFMMPARVRRIRPDLDLVKADHFFMHPYLRFGGTPDFFDHDDGLWQAKCVAPEVFRSEWKDTPPLWVLLQHQAEYLLTGASHGGIICLIRDRLFTTEIYPVAPHPVTIARIEQAVRDFEDLIAAGTPPDIDYGRDAALIADLNAGADPLRTLDMTADTRLAELCRAYLNAGARHREAQYDKDAARAEIVTKIGDASKVRCGDFFIGAGMTNGVKPYRQFRITERND